MLTSARLEIEPAINPSERGAYERAYERMADSLPKLYHEAAQRGFTCYLAVDKMIEEFQPQFRYMRADGLWLGFGQEVTDALGARETGQYVFTLKGKTYSSQLVVDAAPYMYGLKSYEIPAVIGHQPFVREAFTRRYQEVFRNIQVVESR